MNISIGQIWLNKKNPFEYIVPPPTSGVGTISCVKFILITTYLKFFSLNIIAILKFNTAYIYNLTIGQKLASLIEQK